ncbi:VOC family protein [Nocardia sp. CA-145437]|uniref:VOC family protein n=1 Tax=Nocardia sp. CA-145437 TaxID=3239980 RepID=UPI003D9624CF
MDMKLEVVVLPVSDVDRAKAFYVDRLGFRDSTGVFHHAGTTDRVAGTHPERRSYGSFAAFDDPDGNSWFLQEITQRAPGR